MKKILATLTLIAVASVASAASFYLLSKQTGDTNKATPPLPFNPLVNASAYNVIDDIWLIDDSVQAKMANKPPIDDVLKSLRTKIEKARLDAAIAAVTNPQPQIVVKPVVRYTNWFNTTDTNLGMALKLMERDHPNFATNFSPAQRTAIPRTNGGFPNSYQRLPFYLDKAKGTPEFKQLLEEWKRTNGFGQEKPIKGSGGGDYGFDHTAFYGIKLTPHVAPTPQDYPTDNGTNFVWPHYRPALVAWGTYSNLTWIEQWFTNCTDVISVSLTDGAEFAIRIKYPDVVGREPDDFICAEVNLYGECDNNATFDVTNYLVMAAGAVDALWFMYPSPGCSFSAPLPDVNGTRIASLGPDYPVNPWPYRYPEIKSDGLNRTIDLNIPGAAYKGFRFQSVLDSTTTNWTVVATTTSEANGWATVTLPATNEMQFYRVIGF